MPPHRDTPLHAQGVEADAAVPPAALAGDPPRIAYGADKPPATAAGLAHLPAVPLRTGEVLRLNSEAFELPVPAAGQPAGTAQQRMADHLTRLSGGWNRSAGLFIDSYFRYLRGCIAAQRESIEARLRPMAGLFAPEDLIHSAPLPLPRALLPLQAEAGVELCPVDMLFWLGDEARVVLFAPSPLTPGAERRRRERLAAAGIGVTVLTSGDLSGSGVFEVLLGEKGASFWRADILPIAPGAPRLPDF